MASLEELYREYQQKLAEIPKLQEGAALNRDEVLANAARSEELAKQQELERLRAESIWTRDERQVAGEDAERAALSAANVAKRQLKSSGGGAAALAGAEAAENARDQTYNTALQAARERKDKYEAEDVARRKVEEDTKMRASLMRQEQRKAEWDAFYMDKRQEAMDVLGTYNEQKLLNYIYKAFTALESSKPTSAFQDGDTGVAGYPNLVRALKSLGEGCYEAVFGSAYTDSMSQNLSSKPAAYAPSSGAGQGTASLINKSKNNAVPTTYTPPRPTAKTPTADQARLVQEQEQYNSDSRLKNIYPDQGETTGLAGNAKDSFKRSLKEFNDALYMMHNKDKLNPQLDPDTLDFLRRGM